MRNLPFVLGLGERQGITTGYTLVSKYMIHLPIEKSFPLKGSWNSVIGINILKSSASSLFRYFWSATSADVWVTYGLWMQLSGTIPTVFSLSCRDNNDKLVHGQRRSLIASSNVYSSCSLYHVTFSQIYGENKCYCVTDCYRALYFLSLTCSLILNQDSLQVNSHGVSNDYCANKVLEWLSMCVLVP